VFLHGPFVLFATTDSPGRVGLLCVRAFCHSMVVLGFRVCLSAADSSDSSLKWTTAARPVRQGAVWAAQLILAGKDLLLASRKR